MYKLETKLAGVFFHWSHGDPLHSLHSIEIETLKDIDGYKHKI
jgi:hypothetical protein